MIRKRMLDGLYLVLVMLCVLLPVAAVGGPPAVGDQLPTFSLPVPDNPTHRDYLGLMMDQKTFAIPDIKAEVVIVEIFSMY